MKSASLGIFFFFLVFKTWGMEDLDFELFKVHENFAEACAVGDLNKDGQIDVVSGKWYYLSPKWEPVVFRELNSFGKDYLQDNGDHLFDIDGDGWIDIVSGQFTEREVLWFKNPGDWPSTRQALWERNILTDSGSKKNEISFFRDMNGDGYPDYIGNSWVADESMRVSLFSRNPEGGVVSKSRTIHPKGNGHGQGFGDLNGDGLEDIIFMYGWYQRPSGNPFEKHWKLRKDFTLPRASCPIIVRDLNEDGRQDLLWGDGHDYGLYWYEQLEPEKDGTTRWKHHLIDDTISQFHAITMGDLDRDGREEIITGKRYFAHSGRDKGANDPIVLVRYVHQLSGDGSVKFDRQIIHEGKAGTGL
ncbi:MAG: VCBS repeat-containing protein, partial [Opitutae bacterium]|nr:VCBS repeat-containing protein [Opitutae bacterium]